MFLHKPDHVNFTQNYVIFFLVTITLKQNYTIILLFFTKTGLCEMLHETHCVLYVHWNYVQFYIIYVFFSLCVGHPRSGGWSAFCFSYFEHCMEQFQLLSNKWTLDCLTTWVLFVWTVSEYNNWDNIRLFSFSRRTLHLAE